MFICSQRGWQLVAVGVTIFFVQVCAFSTQLSLQRWDRTHLEVQSSSNDDTSLNHENLSGSADGGGRVNTKVRSIMDVIHAHCMDCQGGANHSPNVWRKARNYVYHASNNLTPEQVKATLQYLDEVFPDDPQLVCAIIQSSPRILRRNIKSNLRPTVDFLRSLYGPDLFLQAVSRNENILLSRGVGFEAHDDGAMVESFMLTSLGLKQATVQRLKKSSPWLFQFSLSKLEGIVQFWQEVWEEGKSPLDDDRDSSFAVIGKLLVSHPKLFNLSVEKNLRPRIEYLQNRCQLEPKDVAALMVGSRAAVFGLSVSDNLEPKIDFLTSILPGQNNTIQMLAVKKCIMSHPQILGLSLQNLRTKLIYFDAIDTLARGVDGPLNKELSAPLASRILSRAPAVYSLSLRDNLVPTITFLAGVWGVQVPSIGWENGEMIVEEASTSVALNKVDSLSSLLGESPTIMTLSVEGNLQPTVGFFNRTNYVQLDDKWQLSCVDDDCGKTLLRGRILASSLYNRLLPRWHFFLSMKSEDGQAENESDVKYPTLGMLAIVPDAAYAAHLGAELDTYANFKSEYVPRLKFSSQFDTWLKTGRPIDV